MSNARREYIVTVKTYDVLDEIYQEMEGDLTTSSFIPERKVECALRRPTSRNTHYLLTDDEARNLKNDHRIEAVTIKLKEAGIKPRLHSPQLASWDRGTSLDNSHKNYGLYRVSLPENIEGWGSESTSNQTATINLKSTGKNVDIVVIDNTIYPDHSEFGIRVNQYDWYGELDEFVKGAGTNISNVERLNNAATITTASSHGLKAGDIVNVTCTSNSSFSGTVTVIDIPSVNSFQYTNEGVDIEITVATGFWRGVYQYENYSGENNHATHVAGIIAGNTNGWARESNIYNLKHNSSLYDSTDYPDSDILIDYIREFHSRKPVNPETGRQNPTIVNNSWGFGTDVYNKTNYYTGGVNSRFNKVYYKGSFRTPAGPVTDTGISGVFSASSLLAGFTPAPGTGHRITTAAGDIASVSSTTFVDSNKVGLTNIGAPSLSDFRGVDNLDDAYWNISLPFTISFLGSDYTNLFFVSNSYITFGSGSTDYELDAAFPSRRKIFVSAGDRSCDAIYTGVTGATPNRVFTIRWEGYEGAYGNLLGNGIDTVWEMKFYEGIPDQIDLHIVSNASYRAEFTLSELQSYGLNISGPVAPYRNEAMDADINDAISEGIIFVGSAGNSSTKIDILGGQDYDNYIVDNGLPIYYHRGSTPGSSSNVICVGNSSSSATETKEALSNTGPRVDIFAPGQNIVSSVYNGISSLSPFANDGSPFANLSTGSSVAGASDAVVTVTTETAHGFTNGDIITIPNCDNIFFISNRVAINVIDSNSFSYTVPIAISIGSVEITGTNNNKFTCASTNTIQEQMSVVFTEQTGSLLLDGSPITLGTTYYVRSITATEFSLSLTTSGTILNATGTGTATLKNKITGTAYKGYLYQKTSGTSMSAAQVTGILALALEKYPNMNQQDARNYLAFHAKNSVLLDTGGGFNDNTSLQGANNKFLFYYKERPDTGLTIPKVKEWIRPSTGLLFPRQIIKRK